MLRGAGQPRRGGLHEENAPGNGHPYTRTMSGTGALALRAPAAPIGSDDGIAPDQNRNLSPHVQSRNPESACVKQVTSAKPIFNITIIR